MSKKLVGILGHRNSDLGYGVNSAYVNFGRRFGEVIILDAVSDVVVPVDILILPGGRDVNPLRYGEAPGVFTQHPDVQYEYFFTNIYPKYEEERIKTNKTLVVGICAGFQNLNVVYGGKINQHIAADYSDPRWELVEKIRMIPENQIFEIPEEWVTGKKYVKNKTGETVIFNKEYTINSLHHQGVYDSKYSTKEPHTISDQFLTMARSLKFGNVEAMRHKTLPVVGFQYHPEEMINPTYATDVINTMIEMFLSTSQESVVTEKLLSE